MSEHQPPHPHEGEAEVVEFEEDAAAPSPDLAPRWLTDFRHSDNQNGFYRSLRSHALVFTDRGEDNLVVTFDNLSSTREEMITRDPWGYAFVAKNGWSHLGVMAFAPVWYRDDQLFDALQALADEGFFRRFRTVTLTGTSMGGYAACAFASLAPGCRVVAYSPQSSLARDLVPWEKRFSSGRKADWSGRFRDAAEHTAAASQVWLIHDPHFEEDRLHVERFHGPNIHPLKMRNGGHKTALILRRAGQLSQVTRAVVNGEMTEDAFYALYRQNRRFPWFLQATARRAAERDRHQLIGKMVLFLRQNGQGVAAHRLRKEFLTRPEIDPLRR